ncbi:MAG TPA: class I SAM-dependent methyltransferase [Kofleriaceae bacterium]
MESEVHALIAAVSSYLAQPRELELSDELSTFFVQSTLRGAAFELLAKTPDAPWCAALRTFAESLPREEILANGARFSTDFVSINAPNWRAALAHLVDAPDVHGLEIGSFEGRSSTWFFDHVLTHPTSTMTCVDTFDAADQGARVEAGIVEVVDKAKLESRFDANLAAAGHDARVRKLRGRSQDRLRTLPASSFHFAYLDGSHVTSHVLEDVVLTWRLLRPGAVLIVDDYGYRENRNTGADVAPDIALDAFMTCFAGQWAEIHRGYQLILRKQAGA